MALELRKRVFEFLKANPEKKFKARDIATWICDTYPDEAKTKIESSTFLTNQNELLNQLVAEIGANRPAWQAKHVNLRTTEERPRLYYWSDKTEIDEVVEAEREKRVADGSPKAGGEHDLYPLLIEYLKSELNVVGTRIDERK